MSEESSLQLFKALFLTTGQEKCFLTNVPYLSSFLWVLQHIPPFVLWYLLTYTKLNIYLVISPMDTVESLNNIDCHNFRTKVMPYMYTVEKKPFESPLLFQ